MTRKRVLLLAESPYLGGINTHLLAVLRAFRDHPEFLLVPACLPGRRGDTTFLDAAGAEGFEVRCLPMSWAYDPMVLPALRGLLRSERIELIHTHNYRATLVCAWAAPGTPRVNTVHGRAVDPSWRPRLWQRAELRAMRGHRRTVAVSEFVRNWLVSEGLPEARIKTVHNGVTAPCEGGGDLTRAALGLPEEALLALYVGRLAPGKGLRPFIDALGGMPGVAALIVGDGPMRPELEQRAAALGGSIRFAGAVAKPDPYYRLADVVVLPSRMEALPMTLIEAASHGKPAIATSAGGIPEVVTDGETGLLTEPGEVDQLRKALRRCADPDFRKALGAAALKRWRDCFTSEGMAAALAGIYRESLED